MDKLEFWDNWDFVSFQLIKGKDAFSIQNVNWFTSKKGSKVDFNFSFKKQTKVDRIEISLKPKTPLGDAVINGFQSWSECQMLDENAVQKNLRIIAKPLMAKSGDYTFYPYKQKTEVFHSWHYINFLPQKNSAVASLIASVSPEKGYTAFEWNVEKQVLTINQFCEREFKVNENFSFSVIHEEGEDAAIFSNFFEQFPAKNNFKNKQKFTGWTSWYLHYTNITEDIITRNLNNFINTKTPINYFQIDDGWQVSIGNWECNEKFPNGLKEIANKAKANGIKAGLWLAPFIAEKNSFIFREKKDWLLKNKHDKPIKMTYNPLWSGWFYALDFYNLEAREHIAKSLRKVVDEWGFSILKLDFLYAVGIVPQHNKSRGQVMWEAMCWLRELLKDVEILGCGVPLNVAFGNSDFCRIGPDVSESWDVNWLKIVNHAERLSTKNAIRNSILRFPIDHKAFRNDPDVFILREKNQHLTQTQQFTLYVINLLFGNLLFTSDDISTYSERSRKLYNSQFPSKNISISKSKSYANLLIVHAKTEFANLKIFSNLSGDKQSVSVFEDEYLYEQGGELVFPKFFSLDAYETKIFTEIDIQKKWQLADSDIHILTGNGIAAINGKDELIISKNTQAQSGNLIFYSKKETLTINEKVIKGKTIKDEHGYLISLSL